MLNIKAIYLTLILTLFCGHQVRLQASPKILVIQSYHRGYEWDRDYILGINEVLGSSYELKYFEMDTKRLDPSKYQEQADKAWSFYKQEKPDLVISGDDNALKFLAPKYQTVTTPVVYLGINNNPRYYLKGSPNNITGVLERPLLFRSILTLKKIFTKKMNKIMILMDSGTTSKAIFNETFRDKNKMLIDGVEVHIALIGEFSLWKKTLLSLKSRNFDAVIIGAFHTLKNEKGDHVPDYTVLEWSNKHTEIPPFAFWKHGIGKGRTIGGMICHAIDQGKAAANIAKQILEEKKKPTDFYPVNSDEGQLYFSRHELSRFKITLPRDVINSSIMMD